MSTELSFEYLLLALETARGVGELAGTHYANMKGMISPQVSEQAPEDSDGTLALRNRSVITRLWAEIEAEGGLDVVIAPLFANMVIQGNITSPTTPAGATASREWTFVRAMTTNVLETASFFWGDPNTQIFRAAFGIIQEWKIEADATGEDGTSMSISGVGAFPVGEGDITFATMANPVEITSYGHGLEDGDSVTITGVIGMVEINDTSFTVANKTATTFELSGEDGTGHTAYTSGGTWTLDEPAAPTQVLGGLITPGDMAVWLDDSSTAIGTTELTDGRTLKVSHTIPSGLVEKFRPGGLQSRRTINGVGVGKVSPTTEITFELFDLTQYAYMRRGEVVKLRVRHNGPLIETNTSGLSFHEFVQVDMYGPLREPAWDEYEGTNRTVTLVLMGEKDATLSSDLQMIIQNDRVTL